MSKSGGAFGKFVAALLVILLIVGIVAVALFFVFREQGMTFYVEYGGERYFCNSDGDSLFLLTGETHEFSVKSVTGGKVDFDVKITSNSDNNIRFAYNGEFHYSYTDNAETDNYSDVFGLQSGIDSFTVTIPQAMTVETAIETKLGGDITLIDEVSDDTCYFMITVSVKESAVNLLFDFSDMVITLNPPSIIF